ncbi:MAG: substrate-binding domain-containing protein [Pseudomonadota bacterium]
MTTVHVPHREMGERAARELVAMVEGAVPGRSIRLETAVTIRGSLAAPRDRGA